MNNKGFTIIELALVFILVYGMLFLLRPVIQNINQRSEMVKCANNVRKMGEAIYIYAAEHNGVFPAGIKTLYDEEYLADASVTDCPASAGKGTPDEPDYGYAAGLSVNSPSKDILLRDKTGNHPDGGGTALYVNGAVARVSVGGREYRGTSHLLVRRSQITFK